MWLLFTLLHCFFLSVVNYVDEYLTANNALPASTDLHTKIGGLLLVSTLFNVLGAFAIWLFADSIALSGTPLLLAVLSAIPVVIVWAGYFYLLNIYPVYQVIPLFQLGAIWLLIMELLAGGSITLIGLAGVIVLILGAYLLDSGTLKWQIPTSLLLWMIGVSFSWSVVLFMIRTASGMGASVAAISFWQFGTIIVLGALVFLVVKKYREGLLFRVRTQGRNFLGFSLFNEGASQAAYFSGNMAVALAPLATYFSALGGLQSMMLLFIFLLFPQKPTKINGLQIAAIFMIAAGIFLIEGWKYV